MNLTNAMRTEFVGLVINGIPRKYKYDQDVAEVEIIKAIEAQLPKDILEFSKAHPDLIKREKHMVITGLDCIRRKSNSGFLSVWVINHDKLTRPDVSGWIEQKRLYDEESEALAELSHRIIQIARACTTLKKLQEALPELITYMPTEVSRSNTQLVASGGIVTDLLQLGLKVPK